MAESSNSSLHTSCQSETGSEASIFSKLDVVAEGVETQVQLEFLTEKGCQNVQGYFVSKPLTSEEFGKYIAQV